MDKIGKKVFGGGMSVTLKSFNSLSHTQSAATDLLIIVAYSTYICVFVYLCKIKNNF